MKKLIPHVFDKHMCRQQWNELDQHIKKYPILDENRQVLPFFKTRHDLSLLVGQYIPRTINPDVLAHEYPLYGDFKADLIVGDASTRNYLLVEFEDGRPDSIFKKKKGKATPDWAPRFECAFSQLVDWLWKLDDMRSTDAFTNAFGDRHAKFHGLIVIGKGMSLDAQEKSRLRWREDKILVNSNGVSIVSFEQLAAALDSWLRTYHSV